MASSKDVRPRGCATSIAFSISSERLVKSVASLGSSEKVIRKNSSCGLEASQNWRTASRARSSLSRMLPLTSRMIPIETGASSLEKFLICCGCLFSKSLKLSRSRPVTGRFIASVMVTGTVTSSTLERIRPMLGRCGVPKGTSEMLLCRGATCMSSIDVCAKDTVVKIRNERKETAAERRRTPPNMSCTFQANRCLVDVHGTGCCRTNPVRCEERLPRGGPSNLRGILFSFRVIASSGVDPQQRPVARQAQFDTDLVPLAIPFRFLRAIGQHVLIAQVGADGTGNFRQLFHS